MTCLFSSEYPSLLNTSQPSASKNGSKNSRRNCVSLYFPARYASRCCSNRSTSCLMLSGAVMSNPVPFHEAQCRKHTGKPQIPQEKLMAWVWIKLNLADESPLLVAQA